MKKALLFSCMIIVLNCGYAQQTPTGDTIPIKIKNWGLKSFIVTEEFWDKTQDEIIDKIGKERLDYIKQYSSGNNIPSQLLLFDGNKKVNFEEYHKRLNSLKVYKVVDFSLDSEGNKLKYTILSVPFQKLYWDSTAKWNIIYFVIRSEAIDGI